MITNSAVKVEFKPLYRGPQVTLTVIRYYIVDDDSRLSHSVLPALILPYWSFRLYISL